MKGFHHPSTGAMLVPVRSLDRVLEIARQPKPGSVYVRYAANAVKNIPASVLTRMLFIDVARYIDRNMLWERVDVLETAVSVGGGSGEQ